MVWAVLGAQDLSTKWKTFCLMLLFFMTVDRIQRVHEVFSGEDQNHH